MHDQGCVMTTTRAVQCDGKRQHPNRAKALGHMFSLVRHGASPAALNVYRCRHCGSWHTGHRPRGK